MQMSSALNHHQIKTEPPVWTSKAFVAGSRSCSCSCWCCGRRVPCLDGPRASDGADSRWRVPCIAPRWGCPDAAVPPYFPPFWFNLNNQGNADPAAIATEIIRAREAGLKVLSFQSSDGLVVPPVSPGTALSSPLTSSLLCSAPCQSLAEEAALLRSSRRQNADPPTCSTATDYSGLLL